MGKCFDGIRRLDFGDDPKSTDIFAMVSGMDYPGKDAGSTAGCGILLTILPAQNRVCRICKAHYDTSQLENKWKYEPLNAPVGEGERVSLGKNPLKARGSVEQWLGVVESGMVSSLRRLAKQAMASYPEEPRTEWVLRQPVQLVLAVSQVYWVAAVEEQLRSEAALQGLTGYYQVRADLVWQPKRIYHKLQQLTAVGLL